MPKRAKNRRRLNPQYPVRDLSYITQQGGRTRRHRYMREVKSFLWPVLLASVAQALIYGLVVARSVRVNWEHATMVMVVAALVPVVAAATLTAFRRNGAPIVAAATITVGTFSFAVTTVSALRLQVSYQALTLCALVVLAVLAYANVRFHRTLTARAFLAPLARAEMLSKDIGVPVLSGPDDTLEGVEILLIDPTEHHGRSWSQLLAKCYFIGVEVMPWTRYLELKQGRTDVESFDISHLVYSPSQRIYVRAKRTFDLLAILVTLPITIPVACLVALYIFLRDGGPVIFVQIRRGYGGTRFRMYKFRTMYRGTAGGSTVQGDRRIIPGCGIIRRLRLDELPQLFNILKGDMSLIGPRPVAEYVARLSEAAEIKYALRSLVPPGITGWAQVSSRYAASTKEELDKLSYDLYYIKNISFDLDLLILFRTFITVLSLRGSR